MRRTQEPEKKSFKKARIQECSMKDLGVSEAVVDGKEELLASENSATVVDGKGELLASENSATVVDGKGELLASKYFPIVDGESSSESSSESDGERSKYREESMRRNEEYSRRRDELIRYKATDPNYVRPVLSELPPLTQKRIRERWRGEPNPVVKKYIEERHKYEGFYFSHESPIRGLLGSCISRVVPDYLLDSIPATEFAVADYNKSNNTELKATKLFRANESWFYYFLTFELSDGLVYEALVKYDCQRLGKDKVLFMRLARHFQHLKDAYTYYEFN